MRRRVAAAAVIIVIVLVVSGSGYYIFQDTRSPAQSSNPGSSSGTSTASATGTATTVGSGATSQSGAASSSSGLAAGNGNWTTYHGDNARTGAGPSSNFTSTQLAWKSTRLDGSIYAEPLILGGAVFVATEGDTVYSLAAGTGAVLWQRHLGTPVPGGELPCGDINPSGVTGTPVIDASTQTLYVVAFVSLHHVLFALDLRSGAVLSQQNVDPTSPSGFDPSVEQQRGALTLANGMVYIPYGGLDGDCGQYHGWVVGVPINGTAATMVAYQVPTSREGGIWAPSGASVDPAGNLYVATGNGASDATYDSGDSVIKLSPSLIPEASFAPTDWAQLNRDDADLGSVGPALLDGGSLVFQIGKGGTGYILHAAELGGIGGQAYSAQVCGGGSGAYGGTAYSHQYLFVPCTGGLVELRIENGTFSPAWTTTSFDAGPPIVTAGVVWAADISSGAIDAFSVATGHEVFSYQLTGGVVHFCTPSAGDGMVIIAAGNDQIVSFRLT